MTDLFVNILPEVTTYKADSSSPNYYTKFMRKIFRDFIPQCNSHVMFSTGLYRSGCLATEGIKDKVAASGFREFPGT